MPTRTIRLIPAPVLVLTPLQERVLDRLFEERLLLYHLVTGDTYHYAVKGTGKTIHKLGTVNGTTARKLIYHRRVALAEQGTTGQGGYPYELYTICRPPDERADLPPHMGYDYITLPSGAALGHCTICGAWHLPGDIVAVLTLEELLHYLHLCWTDRHGEAWDYLMIKPGKPASHQG